MRNIEDREREREYLVFFCERKKERKKDSSGYT
jgi:hypothetical protein